MLINPLITFLDSVDSTNNYAMQTIRAGLATHAHAIMAKEQTNGKGQRGKHWQAQSGKNIALTIILKVDKLKIEEQFILNMAISLAVNDFLKKYCDDKTKIKWPNDLYYDDRKAGGILIENIISGNQWKWAVVGIGLNINQEKFNSDIFKPISLKQITQNEYDIIELTNELYTKVIDKFNQIDSMLFFELLKEFNDNLYKINETVRLKKGNAIFETKIIGVNSFGQLHTADVIDRLYNFGEVSWVL